jgi:hypothetical protein
MNNEEKQTAKCRWKSRCLLMPPARRSSIVSGKQQAVRWILLGIRKKLVRASIADISRWSFGSGQLTLNIDDEAASRVTSICRPEAVQVKPPMQPGFGLAQ